VFEPKAFPLPKTVPEDQRPQFAIDASRFECLRDIGTAEHSHDQVIKLLCSALGAAEQDRDRHCADALKLAMAIRLAGLRSHATSHATPENPDGRTRRARALQTWRLKRVVEYIDHHLSARISLSDMASIAGLSRMHFASQFRAATGLRPHEFLLRRRIRQAAELLQNATLPITEIALGVGFQTQAHFTTVFKSILGCTPHQWRMIHHMPNVSQVGISERTAIAATNLHDEQSRFLSAR
jgi:AraC-like DNA-binding protein